MTAATANALSAEERAEIEAAARRDAQNDPPLSPELRDKVAYLLRPRTT